MTIDIPLALLAAAETTKRASDRALMREAAAAIREMRQRDTESRDIARAHEAEAVGRAARAGYESGRDEGYRNGVLVALCPQHPQHHATVLAYYERLSNAEPAA